MGAPTTGNRRELNSHQRASLVTLFLWQGSQLSDSDVARLCGISRQQAWRMMQVLAAAMPIVKESGKWLWFDKDAK